MHNSPHFKQAINELTENILSLEARDFGEELETPLNLLHRTEIGQISEIIEKNRLTIPVYKKLDQLHSPNATRLKEHLRPHVENIYNRKQHRNRILKKITVLLEDARIDYAVFKTINSLDTVGVDIDLIIPPEKYEECVEKLISNKFYSIDDLEKKYATGFMVKGNPVILDLHTDLAILGVRYFNPSLLLSNKTVIETTDPHDDSYGINLVDEVINAIIMVIHCVIKESTVRIDEVTEIKASTMKNLDQVKKIVESEKHQLTTSIFSHLIKTELDIDEFSRLTRFNDTFTHNFSKKIMQNHSQKRYPPYKLPLILSLAAFLTHLKEKNQLLNMTKLFYNLGFSRNAAHLGKKILGNT